MGNVLEKAKQAVDPATARRSGDRIPIHRDQRGPDFLSPGKLVARKLVARPGVTLKELPHPRRPNARRLFLYSSEAFLKHNAIERRASLPSNPLQLRLIPETIHVPQTEIRHGHNMSGDPATDTYFLVRLIGGSLMNRFRPGGLRIPEPVPEPSPWSHTVKLPVTNKEPCNSSIRG
jgi:hypothetical protein